MFILGFPLPCIFLWVYLQFFYLFLFCLLEFHLTVLLNGYLCLACFRGCSRHNLPHSMVPSFFPVRNLFPVCPLPVLFGIESSSTRPLCPAKTTAERAMPSASCVKHNLGSLRGEGIPVPCLDFCTRVLSSFLTSREFSLDHLVSAQRIL